MTSRTTMTDRNHNDSPQRRENPDPHEALHPVPKLLLAMIAGLLVWAVSYIYMAQPDTDPALGDRRGLDVLAAVPAKAVDGAQLFAANCAACHQATGTGIPQVFPPLAGSEWVTGDERKLIQVLLHGVTGPIEVAGASYNGAMPAFGDKLDDEALAALLTYLRGAWGNTAGPVTADAVQAERKASAGRTAPWNGGAELAALK